MLRVLPVPGGILVVEFDAEGGMSVRDERQEVVEFSAERQGAAEAALAAAAAAAANGDVGGNGCAAGEGADGCRGADEASAPAASRRVKGKDEFEEGEYEEQKEETLEQLREFQAFLEKSISGDMTLVNEFNATQLAIQAADALLVLPWNLIEELRQQLPDTELVTAIPELRKWPDD